jgi:hypothetical protein
LCFSLGVGVIFFIILVLLSLQDSDKKGKAKNSSLIIIKNSTEYFLIQFLNCH